MFDSTTYAARRRALISALAAEGAASGTVLFLGNRDSPRNYAGNPHRFRQDSSFLYFVGPDLPGLAATLDAADGRTVLYADDASMDDIVWTGPQPAAAELAALAGADEVRPGAALAGDLAARLRARGAASGRGSILYLPPYREETRAELSELLGLARASVDPGASRALTRAAIALREIKSPAEVAELERAVATSVDMHRAALATARAGMRESDVAARVAQVAQAAGGDLSFPPIATTRPQILHDHRYAGILREGGLFLLDAGAETEAGYAGDLTTTFPIGPRMDSRQRAIFDIVVAMRERASSLIRPGLPYRDAHLAAARVAAEGLGSLGLMRGDPDEAVAEGAHALFFPHGLGHALGLDVHDMESYGEDLVGYGDLQRSTQFGLRWLRLAKPLAAGMALTVEPGLYFIPALLAEWRAAGRHAAFIDYGALDPWIGVGGVRSEEDWLVVPGGGRRLGPGMDLRAEAIEAARAR